MKKRVECRIQRVYKKSLKVDIQSEEFNESKIPNKVIYKGEVTS